MTKRRIMTSVAVVALICFAIISAGCSGTDTEQNSQANAAPSSESEVTVPEKIDEVYVNKLLDQIVALTVDNSEDWGRIEHFISVETNPNNGAVWNPEGIQIYVVDTSTPNWLFVKFKEDVPKNSFYSGPVLLWWREEPGGEVFYEGRFISLVIGASEPLREKPYEYGIETYADPPPEVIKVLSDNNVKLIY